MKLRDCDNQVGLGEGNGYMRARAGTRGEIERRGEDNGVLMKLCIEHAGNPVAWS